MKKWIGALLFPRLLGELRMAKLATEGEKNAHSQTAHKLETANKLLGEAQGQLAEAKRDIERLQASEKEALATMEQRAQIIADITAIWANQWDENNLPDMDRPSEVKTAYWMWRNTRSDKRDLEEARKQVKYYTEYLGRRGTYQKPAGPRSKPNKVHRVQVVGRKSEDRVFIEITDIPGSTCFDVPINEILFD